MAYPANTETFIRPESVTWARTGWEPVHVTCIRS